MSDEERYDLKHLSLDEFNAEVDELWEQLKSDTEGIGGFTGRSTPHGTTWLHP